LHDRYVIDLALELGELVAAVKRETIHFKLLTTLTLRET
jgi:hypothetical protein